MTADNAAICAAVPRPVPPLRGGRRRSIIAAPEHDPEKWTPVSRLREARQALADSVYASAGEARSEKIMLKQRAKANGDST